MLGPYDSFDRKSVTWDAIERSTELVVAFGGMAIKNADVHGGGISKHTVRQTLGGAGKRGARFISISPLRDDFAAELSPNGLRSNPAPMSRSCSGWHTRLLPKGCTITHFFDAAPSDTTRLRRIFLGREDGRPKSADWAASICGIDAETIRALARRMASNRTLITVSHSLQRADFGEQPVWMGIVLAAMLGQIGLDGGGFSYSLGALGNIGKTLLAVPLPTLNQFKNPVADYIPAPGSRTCFSIPAESFTITATPYAIRISVWSIGRVAIRFITIRISIACVRLSSVPRRSSFTSLLDVDGATCRHRASGHNHAGT